MLYRLLLLSLCQIILMKVRLITKTVGVEGTEFENKSIDEILVGIARVSSGREQEKLFDEPYKLIRHLLIQGHWSPYTMGNLTFEIITSRAMGREILRHKMEFQEFSQRYSIATDFEPIELRYQATNNRQSSTEIYDGPFNGLVNELLDDVSTSYQKMLEIGLARECTRMILPETTSTKIYANSTIRGWLSFLNQRLHKSAQKEIRLIAEAIKEVFLKEVPIISQAVFNFDNAYNVPILDRLILEKYNVYEEALSKMKK